MTSFIEIFPILSKVSKLLTTVSCESYNTIVLSITSDGYHHSERLREYTTHYYTLKENGTHQEKKSNASNPLVSLNRRFSLDDINRVILPPSPSEGSYDVHMNASFFVQVQFLLGCNYHL